MSSVETKVILELMKKVAEMEAQMKDVPRRRQRRDISKLGYKITEETDLEKLTGCTKADVFRYLNFKEDETIFVDEVDYHISDQKCQCGTNAFLWFSKQRTGMYLLCANCRTSTGPLSREHGVQNKDAYKISLKEAIQILLEQGWVRRDKPIRVLLKRAKLSGKRLIKRPRPRMTKK